MPHIRVRLDRMKRPFVVVWKNMETGGRHHVACATRLDALRFLYLVEGTVRQIEMSRQASGRRTP